MTDTVRRPRVLLAASGSVAASSLPSWAVLMRAGQGWDVRACVTAAATEFVTPRAVSAATGHPVVGPGWDDVPLDFAFQEPAGWADVVVVIPATANTVAKLAHGMCDNLLLTVVLGATAPVVVVPAVPPTMAGRPAVRRNLDTLEADGFHVVPPEEALSLQGGVIEKGIPNIMTVVRHIRKWVADTSPEPEVVAT